MTQPNEPQPENEGQTPEPTPRKAGTELLKRFEQSSKPGDSDKVGTDTRD